MPGRGAAGLREQSRGLCCQGRPPPSATLPPASAGFSRDYRDDVAEQLLALKDGLVHPDPAALFHSCHSIAQVLARAIRPGEEGLWRGRPRLPKCLLSSPTPRPPAKSSL